jgi:hypothetical protein
VTYLDRLGAPAGRRRKMPRTESAYVVFTMSHEGLTE